MMLNGVKSAASTILNGSCVNCPKIVQAGLWTNMSKLDYDIDPEL